MEVDITAKAKNFIRFGVLGLVLLAVLAGGGVYLYQHSGRTITVREAAVVSDVVPVTVRAAATVTEVVVEDGAQVAAGDVIARIKPNVSDEEIAQLTQNRDLAQKSLEQLKRGVTVAVPSAPTYDAGAQQRLAQAQARYQRMSELYNMGAVSAVKRDEAAADLYAAQAAASAPSASSSTVTTQQASPEVIAQAEVALKQAEAALNSAIAAQQVTEIVAQASGRVTLSAELVAGATLEANQQIAQIDDAANMWIEAQVEPSTAEQLKLGQLATYEIDGHQLQGTLQDIETGSAEADGEPLTKLRISVPANLDFDIAVGTITAVKFTL